MKNSIRNFINKAERGQAIILIAFAFVGLVGMVGLVTDTGLLLIEYGKLKRSVDASAIAAAQQYRVESGTDVLNEESLENAAINFLNLNQVQNVSNVTVTSCASLTDRPALCNPDPVGSPIDNRKLVQVTASSDVRFGFLRVLGFQSVTLTATSVGEAATLDLVLVIDTSASMAFETGTESNCTSDLDDNTCYKSDADDDPSVCNLNNSCQPMAAVKEVAIDFINTMYFPYDRVAIVTMTSQTPGGTRNPEIILDLNSDKTTITNAINNIKVFEPRDCDPASTATPTTEPGLCLQYDGSGNFIGANCEIYDDRGNDPDANPSSCPSSNVGGTLKLAQNALISNGDEDLQRLDAFWVVVALYGGPANATDTSTDPDIAADYPFGFCPANTWLLEWGQGPWCRDKYSSTRHYDTDPEITYDNPDTGAVETDEISLYDAEDYARDMADNLANLITGNGVTIYTIGLGTPVQRLQKISGSPATNPDTGAVEPAPAEALFEYIAEEAGDAGIKHGQYFYAETSSSLSDIFDRIAKNIATKISQ